MGKGFPVFLERQGQLIECMRDRLTERQLKVLLLHRLADLSFEEISALLNLTPTEVKMVLNEADRILLEGMSSP